MSETPKNSESEEPIKNKVEEDSVIKKNNKKGKYFAPYGNYRSYYGYRVGNDIEQDPRFKVLKKDWFEGKDCLDIGCNSGLITINIAKKFHCRSILGVDIDPARISDAWGHLNRNVQHGKPLYDGNMASRRKIVIDLSEPGCAQRCSTSLEEAKSGRSSGEPNLLGIVSFQCGNFVSNDFPLRSYDTITCLSVTKWVHLNWGDEGLITLFTKIWRRLRPGGVLVLEPQPWKSYRNNRLTTETTAENFNKIHFKPQDFQEILLDKIGFRTVEQATSSVSGAAVGFDRPVLVFRK